MGNFYDNITIKGANPADIVRYLNDNGRIAFVSPTIEDCTIVYDRASEDSIEELTALASALSKTFRAVALVIRVHDDDVLWYQLYDRGKMIDDYDSAPGYFDPDAGLLGPDGGDAGKLCAAFGANGAREHVESILRKAHATVDAAPDDEPYIFETQRHADLAAALRLPKFVAGFGFSHLVAGELPDGLDASTLIQTQQ